MKDAYSFDRDEAGLRRELRAQQQALRADLRPLRARGVRRRGGVRDHGRQGVSWAFSRRPARARTSSCAARTATTSPTSRPRAAVPRAPSSRPAGGARGDRDAGRGDDRGARRAARHRRRRDVQGDACRSADGDARARARARRRPAERGEARRRSSSAPSRPATEEEIREHSARAAARSGRSASRAEVIADEALREGQFVAGANRDGWHMRGVEAGRDYEPRVRRHPRRPSEATRARSAAGALPVPPAIEVGHIFKLGTFHSGALEGDVPRRGRAGAGRSSWAATASARRGVMAADRRAAPRRARDRLARSVAPYDVHVVALPGSRSRRRSSSSGSRRRALEVLLDDRELRAGEKFADADLIGCPYRITVGKKTLEDGAVDVLVRQTGEERRVPMDEVAIG